MTDAITTPLLATGKQVLACLDASAYTESVARHAAWAAHRLDAPLEFLHVLDRHAEKAGVLDASGSLDIDQQAKLLDALAALDESQARLAQEKARLLLQRAKTVASDSHGVAAETRLRHGGLVDTLTGLEPGVRLFVLGKRGEHADFARGHLGSQLERAVRAVHRPLLVASRAFSDVRRVLVAFDGSATTRKGVEMVAASPLFQGLDIRVLLVGDDTAAHQDALRWALDTLARADHAAEGTLRPGTPDEEIARAVDAGGVDLLVMGAYGHSRIRQLIVGSTTTTVLRTCRIPVLLLR